MPNKLLPIALTLLAASVAGSARYVANTTRYTYVAQPDRFGSVGVRFDRRTGELVRCRPVDDDVDATPVCDTDEAFAKRLARKAADDRRKWDELQKWANDSSPAGLDSQMAAASRKR